MPGSRRQARVVAGDRRLGTRWPPGRRARSDGHRTRTGGAPAPHGRVLRPRGAAESLRAGPASGRSRGAVPGAGGGLPRLAHDM